MKLFSIEIFIKFVKLFLKDFYLLNAFNKKIIKKFNRYYTLLTTNGKLF